MNDNSADLRRKERSRERRNDGTLPEIAQVKNDNKKLPERDGQHDSAKKIFKIGLNHY